MVSIRQVMEIKCLHFTPNCSVTKNTAKRPAADHDLTFWGWKVITLEGGISRSCRAWKLSDSVILLLLPCCSHLWPDEHFWGLVFTGYVDHVSEPAKDSSSVLSKGITAEPCSDPLAVSRFSCVKTGNDQIRNLCVCMRLVVVWDLYTQTPHFSMSL